MNYVVGFMFEPRTKYVALIRKSKPLWQAGKLNGIGGKIEEGETPLEAMVREFREETGHATLPSDWHHYCALIGPEWRVEFFACHGDLDALQSPEEEPVSAVHRNSLFDGRPDMVENLPWLISLALDHLEDGRPTFVEARYP